MSPAGRRVPCSWDCSCVCHDGWGGAHPGRDCRDRATARVDDRDVARAELAAAFHAHRDGSLRRRVEADLAEEL